MALATLTVAEMVRRIRREDGDQHHFTWVVGSGFSYSAGIPLAATISERIGVFAFLLETKGVIRTAGAEQHELRITNHFEHLLPFLAWYRAQEQLPADQQGELARVRERSAMWVRRQKAFAGVSPDSPAYYSLHFSEFFHTPGAAQRFISGIVDGRVGQNLAHILLAHLLGTRRKAHHTVFTTNFDDLLLEALMLQGWPARVFGDLNLKDAPEALAHHPQIVHVHGRHSSYVLVNTDDQLRNPNLDFAHAFAEHMGLGSVLVVGYAGWDDTITRCLERWVERPELLKGNLYWVAHRSAVTLSERSRRILERSWPGRAFVIVDPTEDLDADRFMLRFCREFSIDIGSVLTTAHTRLQNIESRLSQQLELLREPAAMREITVETYFESVLPTILHWMGERATQIDATVRFALFPGSVVADAPSAVYSVALKRPLATVSSGGEGAADLVIEITTDEMRNILVGKFNATNAILADHVKLTGNLGLLGSIGLLFRAVEPGTPATTGK